MLLKLLKKIKHGHGCRVVCKCTCGQVVEMSLSEFNSGHKKSCGKKECTAKLLSMVHKGKPRPDLIGRKPGNWTDRTGTKHYKLTFLKHLGGSDWLCLCDCGNETKVSIPNISRTKGCRHCSNRKDITGQRVGKLVALESEVGPLKGRHPLWLFQCDCGNTIQGTVREFNGQTLRSCGCIDSAYGSWCSMMGRCYNKKSNRYQYYGGRGITVCKRWHKFELFLKDMGERPKRHNLGRKHAEKDYCKSNCIWEHVSKNGPDTYYGKPTKPGLLKGAKPRGLK